MNEYKSIFAVEQLHLHTQKLLDRAGSRFSQHKSA